MYFIKYVFYKYFLPACGLSSHSLANVFCRAENVNFHEVQLINSFMGRDFGVGCLDHQLQGPRFSPT